MRLNVDYMELEALFERYNENAPDCEKLTRIEVKQFEAILYKLAEVSNGGWISVKDGLPKEHDSIFADRSYFSKHMWTKESDNVNVYVKFPDGTGRVTEGRLQDGQWWTRISPVLNPVITHWMPLPELPKEGDKE